MLPTYGSFLLILCAAAAVGQAAFALCGRREWSWLAPAVGLSVLMAVAWWTVRLPGEGMAGLAAILVISIAAVVYLLGRVADAEDALLIGLPVAALALLAASLPFIVEGRFGILGTGLNPDMSQHLFAADRLAAGGTERLIAEGYPLGPHAVVVAVSEAGPSLVHAFGGLTLFVAVAAALAPLALFERLSQSRRIAGSLIVAFAYMVASYLIQGAFKETIQAMLVLAFAIGLHEVARLRLVGRSAPHWNLVRAIPLALLAVGAVYAYSFPGLLWLLGAGAVWGLAEVALAWGRRGPDAAIQVLRWTAPPVGVAIGVFAALTLPELTRMIDFAEFETFDPAGAGLGNLFNPLSPLEAFGIWPSGDFRLDPGDGAAPAFVYWIGAAVSAAAVAYGLFWWWTRRELAVPSALAAAALLYAYSHFAGTPYQEAKAIALASPLAALIAVRALLERMPSPAALRRAPAPSTLAVSVLGGVFLATAAGCSLIALVNGPVGPASYSPALAELREEGRLGRATLVLAPAQLLDEQHGRDYLAWELRGRWVCVEAQSSHDEMLERAVGLEITVDEAGNVTRDPGPGSEGPNASGGPATRIRDDPRCAFVSDGERADPG